MNNNDNNLEILEEFTYSILKDLKSLEPDISQLVDGYFWPSKISKSLSLLFMFIFL